VTTEKEHFAAQLRGLRLLLGRDNKPISGEALAELSGIALGTVRAIENGLRKLNAEDSRKLAHRLCARWSPKRKRWVDARDGKINYSRALYERYSQVIYSETPPALRDMEIIFGTLPAVFYLLRKLPDKTYRLALLELHDRLQAIAETSGAPPEVFEALKAHAPQISARHNPDLPLRIEERFKIGEGQLPRNYVDVRFPKTESGQFELPFKIAK
jgi:transcriptional regulator with XRE-family HTH domain